jgi:hypothetical protein
MQIKEQPIQLHGHQPLPLAKLGPTQLQPKDRLLLHPDSSAQLAIRPTRSYTVGVKLVEFSVPDQPDAKPNTKADILKASQHSLGVSSPPMIS